MFGMQMGRMGQTGSPSWLRTLYSLFASGQQGVWYDPSNLNTLFQDDAGTTPVTAMEQPVGRMLDLSGNGNHASQATTTKRGVVSRRVNLLTKTEQFDDAVWAPTNITPTLGQVGISGVAPVAVRLTPTTANGTHGFKALFVSGRSGTTHSAYLKADGYSKVGFKESSTSGWFAAFDLSTAAVLSSTPGALPTIQALAGGWCRISFSPVTTNAGQSFDVRVLPNSYVSGDTNAAGFAGDGVSGVLMCGPQMEDGLTATTYQWVNTATDYDADPSKFPTYIRLDGVDDVYQTNSIDFTGTGKMTVWAGLAKDSKLGMVTELSTNGAVNAGGFYLIVNDGGGYSSNMQTNVANSPITIPGFASADQAVIALTMNIPGASRTIRRNSTSSVTSAIAGTGAFGDYPLYIGARAGTSLFFNGRLYQLIVRGAQSSLSQLEAGELLTKSRMKLP